MTIAEGMGARLRTVRQLHDLTQAELAIRSGKSKSLISKVEAGQKPGTWDLAVAVARALHVDAAALMGLPYEANGDTSRIAQALPSLRRALAVYDFPPDPETPPRELKLLAEDVETAAHRRLNGQYVALGEHLPELIVELTCAAHTATGREREQAFWLLAAAYRCADAIAFKLGHMDLSSTAIERIRWAAEQSGDELMIATAAYVRGQTWLVTGAYASGLRALSAAGAGIERRTASDARAAAVYGALHMRAAVLAARGNMPADAWSHLQIAKNMAGVVGADTEYYYTSFGPANVKVHEVAVAVELGDEAEALARASGWTPPASLPAERASHHLIDLARAQVWAGDYPGALDSLLDARARSPQHTRTNPLTRETMAAIVRRERRCGDTSLGLATWLGLSV